MSDLMTRLGSVFGIGITIWSKGRLSSQRTSTNFPVTPLIELQSSSLSMTFYKRLLPSKLYPSQFYVSDSEDSPLHYEQLFSSIQVRGSLFLSYLFILHKLPTHLTGQPLRKKKKIPPMILCSHAYHVQAKQDSTVHYY